VIKSLPLRPSSADFQANVDKKSYEAGMQLYEKVWQANQFRQAALLDRDTTSPKATSGTPREAA